MQQTNKQLAQIIISFRYVVALTGAGISVESGIPAFRGSQGLWSKYDPMEFAHIDAFISNPHKVWNVMKEFGAIFDRAKPNPAHKALVELERLGYLNCIITQNVDNLHQDAGSKAVIEYHGSARRLICLSCGKKYRGSEISLNVLPPTCICSGILKPDVVFFGESIPKDARMEAERQARICDFMLVIGTSAIVAPASYLPIMAKENGATIIEINPEGTSLTRTIADYSIQESATVVLPNIIKVIQCLKRNPLNCKSLFRPNLTS